MSDIDEQKKEAKKLRKKGDFKKALPLFKTILEETGEIYYGCGLLHCLRKLKIFDEAIALADELILEHQEFNWCRNEVIWTYIQGILNQLTEDDQLENILEIAEKIFTLKPEAIAAKKVVFKVLKAAKKKGRWEIVNDWVKKIDPELLDTSPMKIDKGKEGWSEQAIWYNYKIKGLIEEDIEEGAKEAIKIIDDILEKFPKQKLFLLRLKAVAYAHTGKFDNAEKIYNRICSEYKPDWWIFHEYGKVLSALGNKEKALELMCRAAGSNTNIKTMVNLFDDLGIFCKEMGKFEEARNHLYLCKLVRESNEWSVSSILENTIRALNKEIGNNKSPDSLKDALSNCRKFWREITGFELKPRKKISNGRDIRKDLVGKISFGKSERPFCFIFVKNEDPIFCKKSALSPEIKDGSKVIFNAIPSFDMKKNKASWKASNIKIFSS